MQTTTLQKYQTRARNFYRNRCGDGDPTSAQICAALLAHAPKLQPNSFSTLKSALANDLLIRGNHHAAKAIQDLINPTTAVGSQSSRKPRSRKVCSVSEEDFIELIQHLRARDFFDEAVCVVLAYYLGVRPCEMRTITVIGDHVNIIGGKKSAPLDRGADRTLAIDVPMVLNAITDAARWMGDCSRTNTAIRDRLRKECRALWPRRKTHPTLKSFRHQMGSTLKASGESVESLAYIMGHQSTDSISVYGNRRCGDGRTVYVKPALGCDLSKVRKPKKLPRYSGERARERIEFPPSTRGHWLPANHRAGEGPDA